MNRNVTIKDVAKKASVSPATVSRALNDNMSISPETRRKVKEVADQLGYTKNAVALGLSRGNLNVIGVVIADISNPFFSEAVRGIEDTAQKHGYGVILCNTDEDQEREAYYAKFLENHRVGGIIFTTSMLQDPLIVQLQEKIPTLSLSRTVLDIDLHYVAGDDFEGGKMAVNHLIKLGHKRIGYITGPLEVAPSWSRFRGYREALASHKLQYRKAWVQFGDFNHQSGTRLTKNLLKLKDRPTAIFAANDFIALGVMKAVEEAGLHVPNDLAVVGYDDIFLASFPQIQLTTVSQSMRHMGQLAAQSLLKVIKNPEIDMLQEIIKPKLIIRESCGNKLKSTKK